MKISVLITKGIWKDRLILLFFLQVHHEYLNSQASESIELQRLFVFASFSIIATSNKREILNKLLWFHFPWENLCALQALISKTWIFKTRPLLITLMQSALVIMPHCPVVHNKKAFLSNPKLEMVIMNGEIPPVPFSRSMLAIKHHSLGITLRGKA